MNYLNTNGIFAQYHYIPIYKFSVYTEKDSYFSGSEKYYQNSISIPLFVNLNDKDQHKIVKTIKNYFK